MNILPTILLLVAVVSVAGALFICFELLRRRLANYRVAINYDVTLDQQLTYDPSLGHAISLEQRGDAILWPSIDASWQSAFLELRVHSTGVQSHFADPWLDVEIGGHVIRQYFERGGRGTRFINVSELVSRDQVAGQILRLRACGLRYDTSASRLHLLRGAEPAAGPLLILAPHPDDAEIAAFGLFSQRPSWVVTVTLGDGGPSLYANFFEGQVDAYREKARVRAWDSLNIPLMGGVPRSQVANLGYFDGTLAAMRRSPQSTVASLSTGDTDISLLRSNPLEPGIAPTQATWINLVADMRAFLMHIRPAAIVLPHPQIDPHPDHQHTTLALLEALADTDLRDGKLLLYTSHLPSTELYPLGPNDGVTSVPPFQRDVAYFQTLLSVPLDSVQRLRKQIAIEAQHDLRTPPERGRRSWRSAVRIALKNIYVHAVMPDSTYTRRAARQNELFFVVDYGNAARIQMDFQEALERRA